MTQRVICLEFGPFITKICEVERKKKGVVEVTRSACVQTANNCVENGRIRVTEQLVSDVREILHAWGQDHPDIYVSIQTNDILHRTKRKDQIKSEKDFIQEQQEFFLSKGYPYEVYIFSTTKDNIVDILAVPSDIFEGYVDLALCLGATLKGVTDAQYALRTNLYKACSFGAKIVVDIAEESMTVSHGKLHHIEATKFIESSIFPALFATKKYGKNKDIDMVDSLLLLRQLSVKNEFATDDESLIREVDSFADALSDRIEQSCIDIRDVSGLMVDGVIVSGFIPDIPYIFDRIKEKMELPVTTYKSADSYSTCFDSTVDTANTFASCICAFNEDINLLRPNLLHTERYNKYKRQDAKPKKTLLQKLFG